MEECDKRLNLLRSLQNSVWGADRYSLLQIYKAYIRSKLDYGCHLYDSARITNKKKLNVIQNNALRLATGALGCTNIKKLEVESDVPPLQTHRDFVSLNYGMKILSDLKHPTRECLINYNRYEYTHNKPFARRLYDISRKYDIELYNIENKCQFPIPPWIKHSTKVNMPIETLYQQSLKVIAKYSNILNIYTDGSVSNGRTGIGVFSIYHHESTRLPEGYSIFSAEAQAILKALNFGLSKKRDFAIFTDSLSCLSAIKNVSKKTSYNNQNSEYFIL